MSFFRTMKYKSFLSFLICIMFLVPGCKSSKQQKEEQQDTMERGTIHVSADESFKPVIDEQVKVYQDRHPAAKIIVEYKPEAECLKDLAVDSVRMVIVTRRYNQYEKSIMVDSLEVSPQSLTVALDGVAVIVNPGTPDSLFTMADIRNILKGKFKTNLIPVFDGVKATSTVRFIIDSVLRGDSLTPNAVAARSSEGVIDYVAKNPGVIGFIGVSWIGNPEDTMELSFLKKVRMAGIENPAIPGVYVKAYQANIYRKRYPMVRDLVYILKENYKGLGYGFAGFMSGEIGQLIFRRAYLVPTILKSFGVRAITLKEDSK